MPEKSTPVCSYATSRKTKLGKRWVRERNLPPGRSRVHCDQPVTRFIEGLPFCDQHSNLCGTDRRKHQRKNPKSRLRIDPFYDTPTWRDLRMFVLKRDGHTCQYCGGKAHQADHVIPRRRGGPDAVDNLVACCGTCNKTALNAKFPTFAEKKKWILAHRPKTPKRPTIILNVVNREHNR